MRTPDELPEAVLPELPEGLCRTITEWSPTYAEGEAHANAIRAYATAAVRAERERVRAAEPDPALLVSMATCLNHGFGLLDADKQRRLLADMRKLWDEMNERGFYSPANRERYTAMLAGDDDAR